MRNRIVVVALFLFACEVEEGVQRIEPSGPRPEVFGPVSAEDVYSKQGVLKANEVPVSVGGVNTTVNLRLDLYAVGKFRLDLEGQILTGLFREENGSVVLEGLGTATPVRFADDKGAGMKVRFANAISFGTSTYRFPAIVVFEYRYELVPSN